MEMDWRDFNRDSTDSRENTKRDSLREKQRKILREKERERFKRVGEEKKDSRERQKRDWRDTKEIQETVEEKLFKDTEQHRHIHHILHSKKHLKFSS